jgi:hypothetical protein
VGALSDKRTGLPFTIASGPRQRSHSWARVPRDSWSYFTVSDSRLPQPEGQGPRIYIPQEQGGSVKPPVTGVPFRRLLREFWEEIIAYFRLICHGPHRNDSSNNSYILCVYFVTEPLPTNGGETYTNTQTGCR